MFINVSFPGGCSWNIEQMFWSVERVAYCVWVFQPLKAAKMGRFFAGSGTPTKRRGGNDSRHVSCYLEPSSAPFGSSAIASGWGTAIAFLVIASKLAKRGNLRLTKTKHFLHLLLIYCEVIISSILRSPHTPLRIGHFAIADTQLLLMTKVRSNLLLGMQDREYFLSLLWWSETPGLVIKYNLFCRKVLIVQKCFIVHYGKDSQAIPLRSLSSPDQL